MITLTCLSLIVGAVLGQRYACFPIISAIGCALASVVG
jgi:hypothetical protein